MSAPAPSRASRVTTPIVTRVSRPPIGIEFWLMFSAVCSAAGWMLSAFGQLNAVGYAIVLIFFLASYLWWNKRRISRELRGIHKIARRFRHPLPMGFLAFAIMALIGGLLYRPANYDALAYRVPRALHWLAHNRWHWVHTDFPRLNVRACGQEWLFAPLLTLTKTDRWLFVPSLISFLLLPGLFFSVFRQFGVRPKIAWHWMWIAATGYGYVTQAGSIGNDLLGATYALAAFHFGLRLWNQRSARDLRYFVIATGLLTGAKASNFPLLLPLFLLFAPRWKVLFVEPVKNFFALILAALASFMPTAIFNLINARDWTGMNMEGPMKSPVAQFGINLLNWLTLNLCPPIFPFTSQWDKLVHKIPGLSPEAMHAFSIPELMTEEGAGIGAGIVLLLAISVFATWRLRAKSPPPQTPRVSAYWKWVVWSPFIALIVFAFKAQAVHSVTRLILPYYAALLVPFLLFCFDERLLRRRWWKWAVAVVFALAFLVNVLSPARPLWPARAALAKLRESRPSSKFLTRAESVYWIYQSRPNAFGPLVAALPKDVHVFGLLTFDDPETSLWWPLGSRQIEHVKAHDTREEVLSRGIHYVIVPKFSSALMVSADDLIRKYDAKVVVKVPLFIRSVPGLMDWYVLKIN